MKKQKKEFEGNKLKTKAGITLIALVVTIVVLLILAGVSIAMLSGDNGIITKAQEAKEKSRGTEIEEAIALAVIENELVERTNGTQKTKQELIEELVEKGKLTEEEVELLKTSDVITIGNIEINFGLLNGGEETPVTKDWVIAWIYSAETGWSEPIDAGGATEGGSIVAKLYETGNEITPSSLNLNGTVLTFSKGKEYSMVIEGQGSMGKLMEGTGMSITAGYGWQNLTYAYMAGESDTCIAPYISEITISNEITNLGDYAFAGDTSLTKLTIGNDVETIGQFAIGGCYNLESLSMPDSVTSIEDAAFYGCAGLNDLTISNSLTNIKQTAFYGCSALQNLILPNGLISIELGAFMQCTGLESITIPETVTTIGDWTFSGCESLTTIKIPNNLTTMPEYFLAGCKKLTSVDFPDNITTITREMFYGCTSLESIVIPDTVTIIGTRAFQECTNLKSITIPVSVTEISVSAFYECTALTTINYTGTEAQWNAIEMQDTTITEITPNYKYKGE